MFSSSTQSSSAIMEPPPKRFKELHPVKAHRYPDGDVLLVSSDGEEFKVHSYQLRSASPVFAGLLADRLLPPSSPESDNVTPIELTDKDIELGAIVHLLLDAVYGIEYSVSWAEFPWVFTRVMKLFDKYECVRCLEAFRMRMGYDILSGVSCSSPLAFLLAAQLEDVVLASQLVEKVGLLQIPQGVATSHVPALQDHVPNRNFLDLGALRFDHYALIPPKFAHVLLRVTLTQEGEKVDWKEAAKKFKALLEGGKGK